MRRTLGLLLLLGAVLLTGCRMMSDEEIDAVYQEGYIAGKQHERSRAEEELTRAFEEQYGKLYTEDDCRTAYEDGYRDGHEDGVAGR